MIRISNSYLYDLGQFATRVWDSSSQAVLQRLQPGDIEYIDLTSEYFPAFQYLFASLKHDKVLVRDEYRIALDTLQKNHDLGVYVLGQPGIGKSLFLIYALVQLLGQRQAVLLQTCPEYFICFGRDAAAYYTSDINYSMISRSGGYRWALCDSIQSHQSPLEMCYFKPGRTRVIQTASPQTSRWMEWSKQVGTGSYIMDIWSDQEIADLATLQGLDAQRMTTLAQKWGYIPRTLLDLFETEDQTIEDWYRDRAGDAILKCATMIRDGPRHILPDDAPRSFYFLRPKRTDSGGIIRMLSYMQVPTPTLRRLLAEALQQTSNIERVEFYNGLSRHSVTRQTATSIYGSWFHNFVSAGSKMGCEFVYLAPGDSGPQPPIISAENLFTPATLDAPMPRTPQPFYWIAPYRNFPGITSALVCQTGTYAFYLTVGSEYKSPMKGLQILRKRLQGDQEHGPWRVVFVGIEEAQLKSFANRWAGKISFPGWGQVSIAWSVVDPVQYGITYKVYHDEDDAVSTEFDEELTEPGGE